MLFAKQTHDSGSSHKMEGKQKNDEMTCISNVPQAINDLTGAAKTSYQTAFDAMRNKVCNAEAAATRPSCCGQSNEADKCSAHICYKGANGGVEMVYGHQDNVPINYDGGWKSTKSKLSAKIGKAIFCLHTGNSARPQICETGKECHSTNWEVSKVGNANEPNNNAAWTTAKDAKEAELLTLICSTV